MDIRTAAIAFRLIRGSRFEGECFLWQGTTTPFGYGRLSVDGVKTFTHRLAFEVWKGDLPDGLFVCHKCDQPACINPEHLFLGTAQDNARDAAKKGRIGRRRRPTEAK